MYENLLKQINKYNKITIFRHERPDGDAMFSSLGLYYFLKDNFKDKQIKICGNDIYDLVSRNDKVSDKFILESLAFVLDTSTSNRIDDFRSMAAKYIIKIDHHPLVENYADLDITKPESSSASELLAEILLSKSFSKYKISNKVCEYLYCGILTDTINFRTTNTTSKTLLIASKLVEKGNLKPAELVEYLFDINLETYKKVTEIRNKLNVKDGFGYIKLNRKELEKLNMTPIQAKNNIDEIGTISELKIWAFAVENDGLWDCSIRSKKPYIINKIASKYNGGGHPNAAAVKKLKLNDLNQLFSELIEISTKKQ